MSSPRTTYAPRQDATAEAEISVLANVYKFVLDCHAKKKAAPESRLEDEKERSVHDSLASTNYTG
jgi:hypothetical protein